MSTRPRRRRYARRRSRAIAPARRRPRFHFRLRRHKTPKIPLIPAIGLLAGTVAGESGGWTSPLQGMMDGHPEIAIQTAIRNLTGMGIAMPNTGWTSGFQWNIIDTINPFCMTEAIGLKGLMWGSIADMLLGALGMKKKAQPLLNKLPFLKRFSL